MRLGTSETTAAAPTTTWSPNRILSYAGGPWAFNGQAVAVDGVFCLDFTDLLPTPATTKRYHLGMYDSAAGNLAIMKSFKLVDLAHGQEIESANMPQYADGSQICAYIDYNFGNGTLPPAAVIAATPLSGNVPLSVAFDASGSSDPDGTIASYAWTFGDGATGSGMTCAHTYTQPGTFTATLTVTDNVGAQGTATVRITVIDPNIINAPSGLSASVSAKVVTLRWTDNASNETGYYVERALKSGKGAGVYSRIATLAADTTTFSQTVTAGSYYYRVQAFNSTTARQSAYSNVVTLNVKR
jgi:PKD repeat protein